MDDAIDRGLDGILVHVDQAGQPPALYAAGWKDRAAQVAADPHALFKIAGISKLYIAAAAAKQVDSGTLSLDDTLADHAPELVGRIEHADRIPLRMTLRHRSGIPSVTEHPDDRWGETLADLDAYLGYALDEPAVSEPDRRYPYSNTHYLLLGNNLDQALGYSHHRYIEKDILAPLGLLDTSSLLSQAPSLDRVSSGCHDGVAPGGSMVATAQDVGVFLRALHDGSLLDDDEQAIDSSIYEYQHKGCLLGYQSIARDHQDIDAVVIRFVNPTGADSELISLVVYDRIVKILRRSSTLRDVRT